MDMLEVGRSMSTEEDKTHFGMWCIMNSPLLIGCDLRTVSGTALTLLKNKELIALNQDPTYQQAYPVDYQNGCYILVRDLEEIEGLKRAFAVYNPTDESQKVTVNFADLCLGGEIALRDVFQKRDVNGKKTESMAITVPAHGTRIYVATAEYRLERVRYEAETAYISDYQEIKNNQAEQTGIYSEKSFCSSGYVAGWLGMKEQNDLVWSNVYSQYGGEYTLTIAYICGENRKITVSVNGERLQTLNVSSGGWDKVGTRTLKINLNKGYNVIRLSNPSAWMPDIDYIDVTPNSLPDDIETITTNMPDNGVCYDLNGRPASASSRIIIRNGKKYLNR